MRKYGYTLHHDDAKKQGILAEQFSLIARTIEKYVMYRADFSVAERIDDQNYLTIQVYNAKVEYAIYNVEKDTLTHKIDATEIAGITNILARLQDKAMDYADILSRGDRAVFTDIDKQILKAWFKYDREIGEVSPKLYESEKIIAKQILYDRGMYPFNPLGMDVRNEVNISDPGLTQNYLLNRLRVPGLNEWLAVMSNRLLCSKPDFLISPPQCQVEMIENAVSEMMKDARDVLKNIDKVNPEKESIEER